MVPSRTRSWQITTPRATATTALRYCLAAYAAYSIVMASQLSQLVEDHGPDPSNQNVGAGPLHVRNPRGASSSEAFSRRREDETIEKCMFWKLRYEVVPGASWGGLPQRLQQQWEDLDCDSHTIVPTADCVGPEGRQQSLDLVSILAGVSTRGVQYSGPKDLALFRFLLPSIVRTVDCGFDYHVVLGYDLGDHFYDTDRGRAFLKTWFQRHVHERLLAVGIRADLLLVAVNNTIQKPGPVFNAVARAAYDAGADYMYRVNDDSEFMNPWAKTFVRALQAMGWPYGVVGPSCNESNTAILNHDFTHRTHMDIFNRTYYPPELTDWYMDNWISRTYGNGRTRQATSVHILHHTTSQNVRYYVDYFRGDYVEDLVQRGKRAIFQYMTGHGVSNEQLNAFKTSRFDNYTIASIE